MAAAKLPNPLASPRFPEDAPLSVWGVEGQPGTQVVAPTGEFPIDPLTHRKNEPWPRGDTPNDGSPIGIEIVRGGHGVAGNQWVLVIDGVRCDADLKQGDIGSITQCELPLPFSDSVALTKDTKVRPLVVSARVEQEGLLPSKVEVVVQQVVSSTDRIVGMLEDDEVIEVERVRVAPYSPRDPETRVVTLPYPFAAPAQSALAVASYREVEKWREHVSAVDESNRKQRAVYASHVNIYKLKKAEYNGKVFPGKHPREPEPRLSDPEVKNGDRHFVIGGGKDSAPKALTGIFKELVKVCERTASNSEDFDEADRLYRNRASALNPTDAVDTVNYIASFLPASLEQKLHLSTHLHAMRSLLLLGGDKKAAMLFDALLTSACTPVGVLAEKEFVVDAKGNVFKADDPSPSRAKYDILQGLRNLWSGKRLQDLKASTKNSTQFVYDRMPFENRADTHTRMRIVIEVTEAADNSVRRIALEPDRYAAFAAHSVYAGHLADIEELEEQMTRFQRCLFKLRADRNYWRKWDIGQEAGRWIRRNLYWLAMYLYSFGAYYETPVPKLNPDCMTSILADIKYSAGLIVAPWPPPVEIERAMQDVDNRGTWRETPEATDDDGFTLVDNLRAAALADIAKDSDATVSPVVAEAVRTTIKDAKAEYQEQLQQAELADRIRECPAVPNNVALDVGDGPGNIYKCIAALMIQEDLTVKYTAVQLRAMVAAWFEESVDQPATPAGIKNAARSRLSDNPDDYMQGVSLFAPTLDRDEFEDKFSGAAQKLFGTPADQEGELVAEAAALLNKYPDTTRETDIIEIIRRVEDTAIDVENAYTARLALGDSVRDALFGRPGGGAAASLPEAAAAIQARYPGLDATTDGTTLLRNYGEVVSADPAMHASAFDVTALAWVLKSRICLHNTSNDVGIIYGSIRYPVYDVTQSSTPRRSARGARQVVGVDVFAHRYHLRLKTALATPLSKYWPEKSQFTPLAVPLVLVRSLPQIVQTDKRLLPRFQTPSNVQPLDDYEVGPQLRTTLSQKIIAIVASTAVWGVIQNPQIGVKLITGFLNYQSIGSAISSMFSSVVAGGAVASVLETLPAYFLGSWATTLGASAVVNTIVYYLAFSALYTGYIALAGITLYSGGAFIGKFLTGYLYNAGLAQSVASEISYRYAWKAGWAVIAYSRALNYEVDKRNSVYWKAVKAARGVPIESALAAANAAMSKLHEASKNTGKSAYARAVDGITVLYDSDSKHRFRFEEAYVLKELVFKSGAFTTAFTTDEWSRSPNASALTLMPPVDIVEALYETETLRQLPVGSAVRRTVGTPPPRMAVTAAELAAKAAHSELLDYTVRQRLPFMGEHLMQSPAQTALQQAEHAAALIVASYGTKAGVTLVPGDDVIWSCLPGGIAARMGLKHFNVFVRAEVLRRYNTGSEYGFAAMINSWNVPQRLMIDEFAKAWVAEARLVAKDNLDGGARAHSKDVIIGHVRSFARIRAVSVPGDVVGMAAAAATFMARVLPSTRTTNASASAIIDVVRAEERDAAAFRDHESLELPEVRHRVSRTVASWASRRIDAPPQRGWELDKDNQSVIDALSGLSLTGAAATEARHYYCPTGGRLESMPGRYPFSIHDLSNRQIWLEELSRAVDLLTVTVEEGRPTTVPLPANEINVVASTAARLGDQPGGLLGLSRHPLVLTASSAKVGVVLAGAFRSTSAVAPPTAPITEDTLVAVAEKLVETAALGAALEARLESARSIGFNADRLLNAMDLALAQRPDATMINMQLNNKANIVSAALAVALHKIERPSANLRLQLFLPNATALSGSESNLEQMKGACTAALGQGCKVASLVEVCTAFG